MKYLVAFLILIVLEQHVYAQGKRDTFSHSVELGEVIINYKKPDKFANKIHPQNVYIALNPTGNAEEQAKQDATYFVTKFRQPESTPIFMETVELKLKPFDTSMFDIRLIIYQQRDNDALCSIIPLDAMRIGKKDLLKVDLFDKEVTLNQGDFYIGFGFHSKNIPELFKYRMYSTNKGEGAILIFKEGGSTVIHSDSHIPYIFPFKISYRKLSS